MLHSTNTITKAHCGVDCVPHLLWALLDEESQAYELLTGAGVKQPLLREQDIWRGLAPVTDETPPSPENDDQTGEKHAD